MNLLRENADGLYLQSATVNFAVFQAISTCTLPKINRCVVANSSTLRELLSLVVAIFVESFRILIYLIMRYARLYLTVFQATGVIRRQLINPSERLTNVKCVFHFCVVLYVSKALCLGEFKLELERHCTPNHDISNLDKLRTISGERNLRTD